MQTAQRRFRVHARHVDHHHARLVAEDSFEAAAIAYVEHLPHAPEEDGEMVVIVHELDSGHEHCFRIDLDSGAASSCG